MLTIVDRDAAGDIGICIINDRCKQEKLQRKKLKLKIGTEQINNKTDEQYVHCTVPMEREGGGVSIIPAVIFRNSQIMRVN